MSEGSAVAPFLNLIDGIKDFLKSENENLSNHVTVPGWWTWLPLQTLPTN
jgi:hypothetical protein